MADNVAITPGSGATVAADDVGSGVLVQRTKTTWGPDGTANDTDVTSGKPLPVQLRGSGGGELTKTDDSAFTAATSQVLPIGAVVDDTATVSMGADDHVGALRMSLNRNLYAQIRDGQTGAERGLYVGSSGEARVTLVGSLLSGVTTIQSAVSANANGTGREVAGYATIILHVTSSPSMGGGTTVNFEASLDNSVWVAINAHQVGTSTVAATTTSDGDFRINCAGYSYIRARISGYSSGTVTVTSNLAAVSGPPATIGLSATGGGTDLSTLAGAVSSSKVQTNVSQIAGTTADTNSGNKSAGTLRVVLATDQPNLTTALNVELTKVAGQSAISGGVNGSHAVGGNIAHDGVNSGNPDYAGAEAIAHGANPTAVAAADRTKLYANRHGIPFMLGGHPNIITLELSVSGSQTDTAIVTISTGLKIAVTQCQVLTDNANTAFPQIRIGFGTANTPTTTGVVLTHPGLPAGGGVSRGDGSGILGVGADNEDLRVTCGAPTGGSLRILVSYFTIES